MLKDVLFKIGITSPYWYLLMGYFRMSLFGFLWYFKPLLIICLRQNQHIRKNLCLHESNCQLLFLLFLNIAYLLSAQYEAQQMKVNPDLSCESLHTNANLILVHNVDLHLLL